MYINININMFCEMVVNIRCQGQSTNDTQIQQINKQNQNPNQNPKKQSKYKNKGKEKHKKEQKIYNINREGKCQGNKQTRIQKKSQRAQ